MKDTALTKCMAGKRCRMGKQTETILSATQTNACGFTTALLRTRTDTVRPNIPTTTHNFADTKCVM